MAQEPEPDDAAQRIQACAARSSLVDETGKLAGLAIVHVDDLLWTRGKLIEEKMEEVCDIYKFGKIEKDEFRYCGRDVKKDKERHPCDVLKLDRPCQADLSHCRRAQEEGAADHGGASTTTMICGWKLGMAGKDVPT